MGIRVAISAPFVGREGNGGYAVLRKKIGLNFIGRTCCYCLRLFAHAREGWLLGFAGRSFGKRRLVCMSVEGADTMRRKLTKNLMKDNAARERHGPGWGFVARS